MVRQEVAPPPSSASKTTTISKPPGIPTTNHHPYHTQSHPQSYSAVVNTPELRQGASSGSAGSSKVPSSDYTGTNSSQSQGGTNSALSQTDGSSSQEYHQVHSADMDSMNVRGGWTSQEESALSLSEENSGWPPVCEVLDECSQESAGQEVPAGVEQEVGPSVSTEQVCGGGVACVCVCVTFFLLILRFRQSRVTLRWGWDLRGRG